MRKCRCGVCRSAPLRELERLIMMWGNDKMEICSMLETCSTRMYKAKHERTGRWTLKWKRYMDRGDPSSDSSVALSDNHHLLHLESQGRLLSVEQQRLRTHPHPKFAQLSLKPLSNPVRDLNLVRSFKVCNWESKFVCGWFRDVSSVLQPNISKLSKRITPNWRMHEAWEWNCEAVHITY